MPLTNDLNVANTSLLSTRELEVTMVVSSRTQELMSYVMILKIDINFWPSTLHNQMALLRGKIEHLLTWQGQCLVSIM